jgi:RnfABCDGE-type electron transport complex B subunit
VLPQTQCTRCGYDGCKPYADAVAIGSADINRCPPGGEPAIVALAALTGRTRKSLDPGCGEHGPHPRLAELRARLADLGAAPTNGQRHGLPGHRG